MDETTRELMGLWTGVFGEPPPVLIDAPAMIAILVHSLPEVEPYSAGSLVVGDA